MSLFDLEEKKFQVEELDRKILQDGFWNDPKKAQSTIRKRNANKEIVDQYESLSEQFQSLSESLKELETDFDEELMELTEMEYQETK